MKILVVNPGSTSTKMAVYDDEKPLLLRNISHTAEQLAPFGNIIEQQFTQVYDWHLGSGLSIVLMIFILINMIVEQLTNTEGGVLG